MPVLIAVLVGAALAFFAPQTVLWMRPALQPAFALTMLAVGTLVRPEQVQAFTRTPSRPLAGLVATGMCWPAAQRRTLVIEIGMQNAGLGSVLALAHLGEAGAVPSAFYTALCVVTASMALPFSARIGAPTSAPVSSSA
jgi:predicted Na+-dependent transporter